MSTKIQSYIESAVSKLRTLGLPIQAEEAAPILPLLNQVADYDPTRMTAIARALQQSSAFNAIVRNEIGGMDISNRYADIAASFTSIREDAQKMVGWMEDGKLDMGERIQHAWMKVRRGSIPARFADIKKTYLDVAASANDQIARERAILDAYQDYRFGLKQAEVDAQEVLKQATAALDAVKVKLEGAQDASTAGHADAAEQARLHLARDEALRALQREQDRYQIVKDLADNLMIAYNTAEVVFARIQQTSAVKDRVYRQAVTFFGTNEIVFTALATSFTQSQGLMEATNTLEAMKDGLNKGLEATAALGNKQLEAGLRAGYGATISAASVQSLVNAIVDFQSSSVQLIEELRKEATENAHELERAVEDGKARFAALMTKAAA